MFGCHDPPPAGEIGGDGLSEQVHTLALQGYDRMIGLELDNLAVDGCITKAPSGGEVAGHSPVDRGKAGLKRSIVTKGTGLPLHLVLAGANRHDVAAAGTHPGQGFDKLNHLPGRAHGPPRPRLRRPSHPRPARGARLRRRQVRKGVPAPIQAGARWVVERTHSWMNGYGKLRRCTEKRAAVVDFYLFLAAALVVIRQLIQRARRRYRWPSRPTTRRLR